MRKAMTRVSVAVGILLGSGPAATASRPTVGTALTDEEVVLYAYAKLAFYLERSLGQGPGGLPQAAEGPAVVTVSGLQAGPIHEVSDVALDALMTPRSGAVLDLGSWTEGGGNVPARHAGLFASWAKAGEEVAREASGVSLASAIEQSGFPVFGADRYVSYQVSLRWDRKERVYRGLALFGPASSTSESKVVFLDNIAGWGGTLRGVYEQALPPPPREPDGNDAQLPASPGARLCREGICCDAGTSRCVWPTPGANGQ